MELLGGLLGLGGIALMLLLSLLPLILLARISHWAHATQEKLDQTNKLLDALVKKTEQAPS